MDPILELKIAQERKLARRLRGTLTTFINQWFKTDPYERETLITVTNGKLAQILYDQQRRTSFIIRKRGLDPNHTIHLSDAKSLMGGTVKALIELENKRITKTAFKEGMRKWLTRKAIHLSQRDVEAGRWAKAQQKTRGLILKAWRSRMDGIERPEHHNAHLRYQTAPIPINDPFKLGRWGFQLMYPGDRSMGAGPAQTFNCRCSVDYYDAKGKKLL